MVIFTVLKKQFALYKELLQNQRILESVNLFSVFN